MPTQLRESTPIDNGGLESGIQSITNELESINEIALAGCIRSNQHRERAKLDINIT